MQAMDKDLEMRIIEAIPLTMDLNPMYYDSKANILFLLLCLFFSWRESRVNCCFIPIHFTVIQAIAY